MLQNYFELLILLKFMWVGMFLDFMKINSRYDAELFSCPKKVTSLLLMLHIYTSNWTHLIVY